MTVSAVGPVELRRGFLNKVTTVSKQKTALLSKNHGHIATIHGPKTADGIKSYTIQKID